MYSRQSDESLTEFIDGCLISLSAYALLYASLDHCGEAMFPAILTWRVAVAGIFQFQTVFFIEKSIVRTVNLFVSGYHTMSTFPTPSQDDKEGLLLSCRYGDLEETQEYLKKFGPASLADVRDDNGNTVVHMVSGNGHLGEFHFTSRDNCEISLFIKDTP